MSLSWESHPPDFPLGNGSWPFLWTSVGQLRLTSSLTFRSSASPGTSHLCGIFILNQRAWCEAIHQTARCSETAQESSYTQEWLCNGDILFPMITWVSPNVAMAWLFQHLEPENLIYRNNQSLLVPAWGRLRQEAVVNSRLAWHLYLVSSRISGARVRLCLQRKIK